MASRAPKQWPLTKHETITTFNSWKQNLEYTLSLDPNFAPFLASDVTWLKQSRAYPRRGFADDTAPVPEGSRLTASQKVTYLELMLGQVANYAPIISRSTIVKASTSMSSVWQALRQHYGFQRTGAHFLELTNIKPSADDRPEDLYQQILAFFDDNLLQKDSGITHHGEDWGDEELTPTIENTVVYLWLSLLHPNLPKLVKQRYGTELRSRTLASIKPEISQSLDSLMQELQEADHAKVLRSGQVLRSGTPLPYPRARPHKTPAHQSRTKSCPLCKAARRPYDHFLSTCKHLPESDRAYMSKARLVLGHDDEDTCSFPSDDDDVPSSQDQVCSSSTRRVNVKKSPSFKVFHNHYPILLTLDSGAETNMIKAATARYIGAPIRTSSQSALQADGITPLTVLGETHIEVTRDGTNMSLDALVVEELDVDVLAGTPFMYINDVAIRPAKSEISVKNSLHITYGHRPTPQSTHSSIRRTQVLRGPSTSCTVWPGEFVEVPVPEEFHDSVFSIEPRVESKSSQSWLQPEIIQSVGDAIRIMNNTCSPQQITRHDHFAQITPIVQVPLDSTPCPVSTMKTRTVNTTSHSHEIQLDHLPTEEQHQFQSLHATYDTVFAPDLPGYNGASGKFEAIINMGPTLPPQRKGRLPLYSRDKMVELQSKFDELEAIGVFKRPEDVGIVAEYVNPSFLVKKSSGGFRLVTAFADVGRYCKPQPSLMPDIDSTLRSIARWKYLITTDLTKAFYQIPVAKESLKFCGVVTPFRGMRVYTRCAMGMPGSETALEELMCRVFGDLLAKGVVAKLADDLYCGGESVNELLDNWQHVLKLLHDNNLRLSPTKTTICPPSCTILGWIWSAGSISASPHRITTLATCKQPETVRSMRSFIGAIKALSRVLPHCSQFLSPLEDGIVGLKSQDKVPWSDSLISDFHAAQKALASNKSITLPRPSDQLWIVTDGSVKSHGIGATLYLTRKDRVYLAGFYSAKLKKHQVTWLPCEIEALGIAAAIKHFSPYIVASQHKACLLTDSKPCTEAIQKLYRGEFSSSPRVTTFLTTASRFQVSVRHLAGTSNVPSDFASRNAPPCENDRCQICTFINTMEEAVVLKTSVQDILTDRSRLPFTSRSAWKATQLEDADLRRVHAHLSQGTRPSRKLTNIKDIKRYLNNCTIARDGLLIHSPSDKLALSREAIVVPRSILHGLLTALHIKLDHPSTHQLKQVVHRHFYALDMGAAITSVGEHCHVCASLRAVPNRLIEQSSSDPPDVVGISFAADVLQRTKQRIIVLRETATSFTVTRIIPDETGESLLSALVCLCVELRPMDGPIAVIRVDPAPGFLQLREDKRLLDLRLRIEVGLTKNRNKNPVAEKAIAELEFELMRQDPSGSAVTPISLAIATSRLNSRIRSRGLSAREMWLQRDQFTNVQIPISDQEMILKQQDQRTTNHPYSEKSKHPMSEPHDDSPQVGDIVYLHDDRSKHHARERYIITSIDGEWAFIRKFSGSRLRATSYKVKLGDCFRVPSDLQHHQRPTQAHDHLDDYDLDPTPHAVPDNKSTAPPTIPVIPPVLSTPNTNDSEVNVDSSSTPTDNNNSAIVSNTESDNIHEVGVLDTRSQDVRPQRSRHPPRYLDDYETSF